eukprot:Lithocolla_globosa_v1_NODE_2007_length_2211_cov_13.121521.p1 type:complete len:164 gc:universal NODE_2007_length_2211_cov_13.121521:672-181(-)
MAIIYGVAYSRTVLGVFKLILYMVFIDFVLVGLIIATCAWWLCNRYLRTSTVHGVEQHVEWQYAFDVHCNAFLPLFLLLYVLQFFFIPIITADNFLSQFLGNTIYFVAVTYYTYITFLGYNALPFLHRQVVFLYPIAFYIIFYIVSLLTVNISSAVLGLYFGS